MRKLFIVFVALIATSAMVAKDRLYISDFNINPGESKTIEVMLNNDTAYCALQTDIVLPDGITIDLDGDEYIVDLTSRSNKHVISTNMLENGAVRVFVTSQNSRAFTGNSGAILTIDITASDTFNKGVLTLTSTVLAEENGIRHLLDDAAASVNGGGSKKGDVNGDGVVSGADVTALYNVLLDNATASGDCDVNGDGVVSGADVTALYNLLLGQ